MATIHCEFKQMAFGCQSCRTIAPCAHCLSTMALVRNSTGRRRSKSELSVNVVWCVQDVCGDHSCTHDIGRCRVPRTGRRCLPAPAHAARGHGGAAHASHGQSGGRRVRPPGSALGPGPAGALAVGVTGRVGRVPPGNPIAPTRVYRYRRSVHSRRLRRHAVAPAGPGLLLVQHRPPGHCGYSGGQFLGFAAGPGEPADRGCHRGDLRHRRGRGDGHPQSVRRHRALLLRAAVGDRGPDPADAVACCF
jgi:hypothetical protein